MSKLLASLGQMLFPNLCVCCEGYLSHQEGAICDFCYYTIPKFESYQMKDNPLAKKFWGRLKLENATAYLHFKQSGEVRKILHELKYKGNLNLGTEIGQAMGRCLMKVEGLKTVDVIIPIPLHPQRQLDRGYNQSDLLAKGINEELNKKVEYQAVIRKKYNATQTKKKRYERFINSKEIFRVTQPAKLENKHVLLIDDVITTGATIEACGKSLLEVDGLKLSVASLAVAT